MPQSSSTKLNHSQNRLLTFTFVLKQYLTQILIDCARCKNRAKNIENET